MRLHQHVVYLLLFWLLSQRDLQLRLVLYLELGVQLIQALVQALHLLLLCSEFQLVVIHFLLKQPNCALLCPEFILQFIEGRTHLRNFVLLERNGLW